MSFRMVNAKHDAHSYESTSNGESGYQREIYDGNALYDAYERSKRNSDWKPQVQKFEMNYLLELSSLQAELRDETFEYLPSNKFIAYERGKVRAITGDQFHDRITKHVLCDEILNPTLKKYFIYDTGASLKGKGLDFTRDRLLVHLRRYYMQHKTNEGYILLIDFSKYFDNIRHAELMELYRKYINNAKALWLLEKTLAHSKVDVSYMSDEEYAVCIETVFNSLDYHKIDKALLTGEKFMHKHLNIGDQVAQTSGMLYPLRINNYIKIVRSIKYHGQYMDDSYVIDQSKEFLEQLLDDVVEIANELGITVNLRKTRICKLSDYWRFLQVQYSLTETGRVIRKINPKRLTVMRHKMKKLVTVMPEDEFKNWYDSWFKGHYKIMSKLQRQNLDDLYKRLKEENYVHNNIS